MTENDAQNSPKGGDDIIVPEISENDARNESLSSELNFSKKWEFFSSISFIFSAPQVFFQ